MSVEYQKILSAAVGEDAQIAVDNDVLTGKFSYQHQQFALCGIVNGASLDNAMSLQLADFILELIKTSPQQPICILIDTAGQKVSHTAELLGLNSYYGHLISAFNLARQAGHKIFALVYGQALGGAFIASALNADYVYATKEAQIAVMWLEAMSRVTKVPLAQLQELSQTSAIFAPGAENYVKLGVIEAVISAEEFLPQVCKLVNQDINLHRWREQGASRGGRLMADNLVKKIINQ